MKYLCMAYFDETRLAALSVDEFNRLRAESIAYNEELRKAGHYVASNALERISAAATIRPVNGKLSITDGPFAETKEQLGGFVLIEARDRAEAIAIASKIPVARLGCIEVRPTRDIGAEVHPSQSDAR